jgi:hypothetical protein
MSRSTATMDFTIAQNRALLCTLEHINGQDDNPRFPILLAIAPNARIVGIPD